MLGAVIRFLRRAKDAWEWYSLLAVIGIVPGLPVVLGVFEGQPPSVLALYATAALAFWVVIFPEVREVVEQLRRRRVRVQLTHDPCCNLGWVLHAGVGNVSAATIHDVLVYADLVGAGHTGRVLLWVDLKPDQAVNLDPGPPHHHFVVGYPHPPNFDLTFAYGSVQLRPGDHEVILYVKGRDLTAPPQRAIISVDQSGASLRLVD
jgi:hypothetical protein